ncbi:MAG: hypothetical protein JWR84_3507 [Caulobacter sp.]|nr:hypothetical protein [Caulobacter sp.]
MRSVPDTGSAESRAFAEGDKVSETLAEQVKSARQALSDYHAAHPVIGADESGEPAETARERAVKAADQPDLHPKA